MKTLGCILAALTVAWTASPVLARGGGGCLEEGALVSTDRGALAVERVEVGQSVLSVGPLGATTARVLAKFQVQPAEYVEIAAGGRTIRATAEHPFMVAAGVFRQAASLRPGDSAYLWNGKAAATVKIDSVRSVATGKPAYNLLVVPGGTYIVSDFVVHNKGCFLPDTPILRADGTQTAISEIRAGDELLAFTADGKITRAQVQEIITHEVGEYVLVRTDRIELKVTEEHPFFVRDGTFKTVQALSVGERIFAYDGVGLSAQRIISIRRVQSPAKVYNLQTSEPHTFFAMGVAVHNKGCFAAGTRISTPAGPRAIETLRAGEAVLAVGPDGRVTTATIQGVFEERSAVLELHLEGALLRTTAEHPIATAPDVFVPAGEVREGQSVLVVREGKTQPSRLLKTVPGLAEATVYTLSVGGPHTFIAEGVVVHNKGGCFPAGTKIACPTGEVAIERLSPSDTVQAIAPNGKIVQATVERLYQTRSEILELRLEGMSLRTTAEHPIAVGENEFMPAGQLRQGDVVLVWVEGELWRRRVLEARDTGQTQTVYNLSVSWPHTFIADGVVVHNKGGGFGGGRIGGSRGSTSGPAGFFDNCCAFVPFGVILIVIVAKILGKGSSDKSENLDYNYSRATIAGKANKTGKLLDFLAKQDGAMSPQALKDVAGKTFLMLQECWGNRNYEPMKPLLMTSLYNEHLRQINSMIGQHEINKLDNLRVLNVDIVNVRYTNKDDHREFTALISAQARDYYIDDRNHKFLRGDEDTAKFQEFWVFQRQSGQWLLRDIEQAGESNVLKDENFVEMFTDRQLQNVYSDTSGQSGQAGPWLEKSVELKATRTERMLNFLVQTDKLWNRQVMLERSRDLFVRLYTARETGATSPVLSDLFPDVAQAFQAEVNRRVSDGIVIEFRNLCVRKVELMLVRNFNDNSKDEFVVRISAHAQKVMRRPDGQVLNQDEYVSPFEEYWTMGRLDGQWKLKEVLPSAKGEQSAAMENVDEGSGKGQMDWYYRQTRAN